MNPDRKLPVLDQGFVRLESWMGGDQAVVRSARVSYKSEAGDEERDRKLIAYLLAHEHGTPFEHAVFTFHVKLPIFVARQWIRHRMSSYNETSLRYREAPDEFYVPERWRAQDTKDKQGSAVLGHSETMHSLYSNTLRESCEQAMHAYRFLLAQGVAREMARMVLPVNAYTEWYWTVNARALMHFLTLRCESHAQWEIREYAYRLAFAMQDVMPWTFNAWASRLEVPRYQGMFEFFRLPALEATD